MMTEKTLWQKPQLRTDEEEHKERGVSWIELFFDLVFVIVIAELAHSLSADISVPNTLVHMLLFMPVWWAWLGSAVYKERFETEDVSNHIITFIQMLPVAGLAVFAHDALGETSAGFALSYAAVRIFLIFLWLRGGWHVKIFRPLANRYAIGFGLSVLLFIVSVFVPPPTRFILWGVGLLIDFLVPLWTFELQAQLPQYSASKLPERFGLLMIIMLGETVVGTIRGTAESHELLLVTGIAAVLGMTLSFCLWWVYFDFVGHSASKPGIWWLGAWGYLHIPLVMGIGATGAGLGVVIANESGVLPGEVRGLIAGSIAVSLIAIGLIEPTLRRGEQLAIDPRVSSILKFATAAMAILIGFFGQGLNALTFLLILILLVSVHILYSIYATYQFQRA